MNPKLQQPFRLPGIAIKLDETLNAQNAAPVVPVRVQILKTGEFYDERYGSFSINSSLLRQLKENFDKKVRGIDISIDYSHENLSVAAGWIQSLELAEDDTQLWAVVKWTPKGEQKLSEKEFRYISSEFLRDYQDNETLKKFGPCLLGAGLTNRPVIKGLAPVIELQEGKGNEMDPKDKKIKELADDLEAVQGEHKKLKEEHEKMASEYAEFKKKAGAGGNADKDSGDGADDDDADGDAQDDKDNMKKELSEMKAKLELSEKKSVFAKLLAEQKAVPAQEEAFLKGDMLKFAELGNKALNTKGHGHSGTGNENNEETPAQKVMSLAEKKVNDKKAADIGSGISQVLAENSNLAEDYYKFETERQRKARGL